MRDSPFSPTHLERGARRQRIRLQSLHRAVHRPATARLSFDGRRAPPYCSRMSGHMDWEDLATGEATAVLHAPGAGGGSEPIQVIGTAAIRRGFDEVCLQQAINVRGAPGVAEVALNPDAHRGFGAPIGCVLASPSHIYPGPVGVDIKCSMSLLQLDLPAAAIGPQQVRRALIHEIARRVPTGPGRGQRHAPESRSVGPELGEAAVTEGASGRVCAALGIPAEWRARCEDWRHLGHDGTTEALARRLAELREGGRFAAFAEKIAQLGSYGGGNHFGECEVVRLGAAQPA